MVYSLPVVSCSPKAGIVVDQKTRLANVISLNRLMTENADYIRWDEIIVHSLQNNIVSVIG